MIRARIRARDLEIGASRGVGNFCGGVTVARRRAIVSGKSGEKREGRRGAGHV